MSDTPLQPLKGRIPVLDGWRGIAVLTVLVHNAGLAMSYTLPGPRDLLMNLTSTGLGAGWVGVQLFFVLSGFLITGILLQSLGRPRYFSSFYKRRTFRIFPVYYVYLTAITLLGPALLQGQPWADQVVADRVWYWLYLANWKPLLTYSPTGMQHLWSLSVEEQFYLVWPMLVVLAGRQFGRTVALIVLLGPVFRGAMIWAGLSPEFGYYFTPARADALAIGALLAVASRTSTGLRQALRVAPSALAASSVGLIAVVLWTRGFAQFDPLVVVAGQTLSSVWFTALMLQTMQPATRTQALLASVLRQPALRLIGRYSYAMYVVHLPISQMLTPVVAAQVGEVSSGLRVLVTLAFAMLVVAASTVVAAISWRLLERPMERLKERFSPRAA